VACEVEAWESGEMSAYNDGCAYDAFMRRRRRERMKFAACVAAYLFMGLLTMAWFTRQAVPRTDGSLNPSDEIVAVFSVPFWPLFVAGKLAFAIVDNVPRLGCEAKSG
jgi:hypothetical protein